MRKPAAYLNVHEELPLTYHGRGGKLSTYRIASARESVAERVAEATDQPAVREWYETVFLNWLKRDGWRREAGSLGWDAGPGVGDTLEDMVSDYFGDMLFEAVDDDAPDAARYGGDRGLFLRDLLWRLPPHAAESAVLLPVGFGMVYDAWGLHEVTACLVDLAQNGRALGRLSVRDAALQTRAWRKRRARAEGNDAEGEDVRTVMRFPDGFRVVRLLTPKALDRESALCGHCVGEGGYDRDLRAEHARVYSLRDGENTPHATVAARDGDVVEVRGFGNGPVPATLRQRVKDFLLAARLRLCGDHDKLGLPSGIFENG